MGRQRLVRPTVWPRPAAAAAFALALAIVAACAPAEVAAPAAGPSPAGARVVSFQTEDGLRLDGRLFDAGPRRVAILLHMYPSDQTGWYPTARELWEDGVSVLTFDFRGYGDSEGERDMPGRIDLDVRAAVAFARAQGYGSVVLVGASMGGTAAIVAAADTPVAGVITLSAPLQFGALDAESAVTELDAPLAVLATRQDASAAHSLEVFAAAAGLDDRHAVLYEGDAHGTEMLTGPDGERVRRHLRAVLDEFSGI